jgi:antitoxin (DNA-binding transcriptional repressor) of toxin-antitoxin stability system
VDVPTPSSRVDLVATGSYYKAMKSIERVGVKNLKNNLSAYLRQVKRGVRVLITDRDEVVAELGKPRSDIARSAHPLLAEWIASGDLRPATARKKKLPASPVKLPAGTAQRLLDADREE